MLHFIKFQTIKLNDLTYFLLENWDNLSKITYLSIEVICGS